MFERSNSNQISLNSAILPCMWLKNWANSTRGQEPQQKSASLMFFLTWIWTVSKILLLLLIDILQTNTLLHNMAGMVPKIMDNTILWQCFSSYISKHFLYLSIVIITTLIFHYRLCIYLNCFHCSTLFPLPLHLHYKSNFLMFSWPFLHFCLHCGRC